MMLNITVMYSQHIKRVSTVIQSLPKDTHDSSGCHFSHGAFSAPHHKFPFIYSCITTVANCFVNGTLLSASPVNTMSLAMLIISLFA